MEMKKKKRREEDANIEPPYRTVLAHILLSLLHFNPFPPPPLPIKRNIARHTPHNSPHVLRRRHDHEADRPLVTENLVSPSTYASNGLDGGNAVVRDQHLLDDAASSSSGGAAGELGHVRRHVLEATVQIRVRGGLGHPAAGSGRRCRRGSSRGLGSGGEGGCHYFLFLYYCVSLDIIL